MIELHSFLNDDSPQIAAVWNSQPPLRGRIEKLTTTILEQYILSKPYFDPRGLILASESGRPTGFIHVGFAPGQSHGELVQQAGMISLLMVSSQDNAESVASSLLAAGEKVLRERGAQELLGGGSGVHAPFYLGLYGGCQLPGVLAGDAVMRNTLQAAGYEKHREYTIWQRTLATFRPPVDRELMQLRRQYRLRPLDDDSLLNWSDACAYSWTDPRQFGIDSLVNGTRLATLSFWNVEPLATGWGQRTMGLAEVALVENADVGDKSSDNLLTCFLAEAMRQFQAEGTQLVEVQVAESETALAATCKKLGFQPVDRGIQYRKPVSTVPG